MTRNKRGLLSKNITILFRITRKRFPIVPDCEMTEQRSEDRAAI